MNSDWKPQLEYEYVTDGLPLWGALALGLTVAFAAALLGVLIGLAVLA